MGSPTRTGSIKDVPSKSLLRVEACPDVVVGSRVLTTPVSRRRQP
jgi:hypothetical protein